MVSISLNKLLQFWIAIRLRRENSTVLKTIDLDLFENIKEKYQYTDPPPGYSKYLDIEYWMKDHLQYALKLNLHRSEPLRILDLGTGCGYFPYICRHYGHSATAVDLGTVPMYNEVIDFLGIDRRVLEIKPFSKLPYLGSRFDLITAFGVCFNNHNQPDLWGVDEWSFFLEDITRNHMSDSGRVFIKLNAEKKDQKYYSEDLYTFFLARGAVIEDRLVYFPSMNTFRT